jgi:hypothetical protein
MTSCDRADQPRPALELFRADVASMVKATKDRS